MAKILIVDDEPDIILTTKRILEKEGHEVVTASSGEEALEKLKEIRPDLILLDIMMPDLDGWQTLRLIRKEEALANVPVSMLTSKRLFDDYPEDIDELVHYIHKPILRNSLRNKVKDILGSIETLALKKEKLISKAKDKDIVISYEVATKKETLHKNLLVTLKESLNEEFFVPELEEHINNMIAQETQAIERFKKKKKEIEDTQG